MPNVTQKQSEREAHMRKLARQLEFTVDKTGDRFTLIRVANVTPPVCAEHLTLDQAEELLSTWKLRGHGS